MDYYKIKVTEEDELGMDFNSFVDVPAHMRGFIAFNGVERYQFNDEKRIVTGVMISANTPIYRNSPDLGEHYVIFDAQTIDIIRKKFFKEGFTQNVNLNHDMSDQVNGATLIDSYVASNSDPKLPNIPEVFEKQKLQDGTWIASYYITDPTLWDDVKSGKFNGFSVEGWFDKVKINVKNKNKMSKETKSIWDFFGLTSNDAPATDAPAKEEKFVEATTADGVIVFYDGELMEGTMLEIESEGERLPAPEGEHQLTLEDGSMVIVTLDATGSVLAVEPFEKEEQDGDDKPEEAEIKEEVAVAMKKIVKDVDERFKAIEAENKDLKEKNEALEAKLDAMGQDDKFNKEPKKATSKAVNHRKALLNKK